MRPLIGVTTSELRPSRLATTRRHGEPAHPEMALGMTYLRTLDAAGAIPVVLPPVGTDHLAPLIERLDGICLSGGPDLDPAAYGADERHTELGPTEPSLDAFELSLVRLALMRRSPSAAPRAAATARRASAKPARSSSARASSAAPAGVSRTRRRERSNNGPPSSSSRAAICWLTADCERCRSSAARVKLVWRATARNTSRRRASI